MNIPHNYRPASKVRLSLNWRIKFTSWLIDDGYWREVLAIVILAAYFALSFYYR